jgi:hypothetical protein
MDGVILLPRISEGMGPSNNPEERRAALRLGTSSSTYDGKLEWSGDSAPETEQSSRWPVPAADSPSFRGQPPRPTSSSATTTDGSTQETGASQSSQQDSSEDSAPPREPTQDQAPSKPEIEPSPEGPYAGLSGHELMALARDEYSAGNLDEADRLITAAEQAGGVAASELATARRYVATARARRPALGGVPRGPGGSPGYAKGVPSAGGYLTGA